MACGPIGPDDTAPVFGRGDSSACAIDALRLQRTRNGQWMVVLPDARLPIAAFIDAISNRTFSLDTPDGGVLSRAERAAMFRFVNGGEYRTYNLLLRDPTRLSARKLRATLQRVVAMQSGINKLPDYQGVVYRVAVPRDGAAANYNGVGIGKLQVGATTTTNTFVGACRFAFVMVEHAPVVFWTAIRSRHASVQPASAEEVTFPLGTPIETTRIQQLDPRRIVAHIDQDAELKWVRIGANDRPFIGMRLTYGDQTLPDFYFLSAPPHFRRLSLASFTRLFDGGLYSIYAQRELDHFKQMPPDRRFQDLWTSRLDSLGRPGRLPEVIHFVEAQEKPRPGLPIPDDPNTGRHSTFPAGLSRAPGPPALVAQIGAGRGSAPVANAGSRP